MKRYFYLLFTIAIITSCTSPEKEYTGFQNQLKLNSQRNAQIIHSIELLVEDTGSRSKDVAFLNTVKSLLRLKNEYHVDFTHSTKDSINEPSSIALFIDSLEVRFKKHDIHQQFSTDFKTATKLLEDYKITNKKDESYYQLLLQVSFLETLLLEKYLSYGSMESFIFIVDYHVFIPKKLTTNAENKIILTLLPTRTYSNANWKYNDFKLIDNQQNIIAANFEDINGALLATFSIDKPNILTLTGTIKLKDSLTDLDWDIPVNENLTVND